MVDIDILRTGDIVLYNAKSSNSCWRLFENIIKCGTHSNYTHVAMIVRDPSFTNPPLKGVYVWESSFTGKPDPQDGKIKVGVQLTRFEDATIPEDQMVFTRHLQFRDNPFTVQKLKEIHEVVYNKPYDIFPKDWIEALVQTDSRPQKTDRFWCSALIGYVYTTAGILDPKTDWSILRPSDFSLGGESLKYISDAKLEPIQRVLNNYPQL